VISSEVVPPCTCVPDGNFTLPETPAKLGSAIVCATLALDESVDDDDAQGATHAVTGLAVGTGLGVGPGGVDEPPPLPPPPHAANNGTNAANKAARNLRRVRIRTASHPQENDIAPFVQVCRGIRPSAMC
jgi:hypothetical protein